MQFRVWNIYFDKKIKPDKDFISFEKNWFC